MSEYDAEMYESFSLRVRRQVQSLRVILDSLQARGKERVWLRNQTSGELDDSKLIEGLAGERAIYKKRGEEDPEVWQIRLYCCSQEPNKVVATRAIFVSRFKTFATSPAQDENRKCGHPQLATRHFYRSCGHPLPLTTRQN